MKDFVELWQSIRRAFAGLPLLGKFGVWLAAGLAALVLIGIAAGPSKNTTTRTNAQGNVDNSPNIDPPPTTTKTEPSPTAIETNSVPPTQPSALEVASDPTGDADLRGECPRQTFVGLPVDITMKVKNTGDKTWPVTFLTIDNGADHFVFNNAHVGALVSEKVDTPAFDTWQLGTGDGLKPGDQRSVTMTLTPKDAGNRDLSYGVWGGPAVDGPTTIPDDLKLVSCSAIPVNP